MSRTSLYVLAVTVLLGFTSCQKGTEITTTTPAPTKQTKQLTRSETAMMEDAARGDTAAVKRWLDEGVDVNMRGNANNTPIMEAAYAGKLDTVKLLLDHGADLSVKKIDGASVISLGGAHPPIIELFRNVSALVSAASQGDNEMIKQLIAKGTPVNGLDEFGQSALTEATWKGHTETVKVLLENGADPNVKKSDGELPLNLARAQKRNEIAALLEHAIAKRNAAGK